MVTTVDVTVPAGRLRVRGRDGITGVQVRTLGAKVAQDARAALAASSSSVVSSGESFVVSVGDPGGRGRAPQVLVELDVPTGTRLRVDAGEAEVVCTGSLGALDARTSSGSVNAELVTGPTAVRTGRGPVSLHRCEGPASISSADGTVIVREATEKTDVTTRSGDVHVWWLAAPATVRTSTGNVRLGWDRARPVRLDLTTTSGRLQLGVTSTPEATDELAVRTISGDIRIEPADPVG